MGKFKQKYKVISSQNPIYTVWYNMKNRCYNPNDKYYKNYGGRGITICDKWLYSFDAFYIWCIANGWRKELRIDRRENNGNYEPGNCRFVTDKENARNKTTNVLITFQGTTKTLIEWAEEKNIKYHTLCHRIRSDWSLERLFNPSEYITVTLENKTKTLYEWGEMYGIKKGTLKSRWTRGKRGHDLFIKLRTW